MAGGLAFALACGTAFGQTAQDAPAAAAPAAQSSVKLAAVVIGLPVGTSWISLGTGPYCIGAPLTSTWTEGRTKEPVSAFAPAFKAEMERTGYKVITPGEDNLFDPESGSADLEAAAVITGLDINGCIAPQSPWTQAGAVKGSGSMTIDWQVYSPLKKQVGARVTTSGTANLKDNILGGQQRLQMDSFADNAASLATNADFRAAMTAPRQLRLDFRCRASRARFLLAAASKPGLAKSRMRWEMS